VKGGGAALKKSRGGKIGGRELPDDVKPHYSEKEERLRKGKRRRQGIAAKAPRKKQQNKAGFEQNRTDFLKGWKRFPRKKTGKFRRDLRDIEKGRSGPKRSSQGNIRGLGAVKKKIWHRGKGKD